LFFGVTSAGPGSSNTTFPGKNHQYGYRSARNTDKYGTLLSRSTLIRNPGKPELIHYLEGIFLVRIEALAGGHEGLKTGGKRRGRQMSARRHLASHLTVWVFFNSVGITFSIELLALLHSRPARDRLSRHRLLERRYRYQQMLLKSGQ